MTQCCTLFNLKLPWRELTQTNCASAARLLKIWQRLIAALTAAGAPGPLSPGSEALSVWMPVRVTVGEPHGLPEF